MLFMHAAQPTRSTRSTRWDRGTINKQTTKRESNACPHAPPSINTNPSNSSTFNLHLYLFDSPSSTNDIYLQPTPGDTDYTTTSTTFLLSVSLVFSKLCVACGFGWVWFETRKRRMGKDKGIPRRSSRCKKMKEVIVRVTRWMVDDGYTSCGH